MKELIKNSIGNNFYCKLFFVLVPFLNEIPVLTPYVNPMMKIGLVIGALYILYDLFHDRNILHTACIVPAVVLILSVAIGSLMHRNSPYFRMNLIELAYTIVSLMVLFTAVANGKEYKELSIINYLSVIGITAASAVSLYLVLKGVNFTCSFNGQEYSLGVYNGRLVGVFRNSIYPTAAIGVFCALIQIFINNAGQSKHRYWLNALLITSIVINTEVYVLQYSSTIYVSLAGAAFVFIFFVAHHMISRFMKKPRTLLSSVISFGLGGISVGATFASMSLIRNLNIRITDMIAQRKAANAAQSTTPTPTAPPTEPPTEPPTTMPDIIEDIIDPLATDPEFVEQITEPPFEHPVIVEQTKPSPLIFEERVVDERYGLLTGRPYMWKTGIKSAMEQPLFGYGPYTFSNSIRPFEGSTEQISHFHNIFVHTLVSGGIIGLLAFSLLALFCVCRLVKALFTQTDRKDYLPFAAICALLVFIFILNMADTTILFMTKHSGFIFFIYLGYAMTLVGAKKPFKLDLPAVLLDKLLSKNKKAGD